MFPTAQSYVKLDHRSHVYLKSDTYIGADEKFYRDEWLFDLESRKISNTSVSFVPGCERLFLEVLTNASDNVGRSRRAKVDPGKIDVTMDEKVVTVRNGGLPIPIEKNGEGVYVPQMIFGDLLTSSNYEQERRDAGTNGIGAKATNIFSKKFSVVVEDASRKLRYSQEWSENMKVCSEPTIEKYGGKGSSVLVSYEMDFPRFGYSEYPEEAFSLYARHAVDMSFTSKVAVSFNGVDLDYSDMKEYGRLYFGEAVENAIVHRQSDPEAEMMILDTPDEGCAVSFVNCMMTREGGVHVQAAMKAIGDPTAKLVNSTILKKLEKKNLDAKEKRSHTISVGEIRPHISILLSVRLVDPKFTSQTKTTLHSPTPKISLSQKDLDKITKWKLIDRLYAALEAKQSASMSKTDGKLKKYVRLLKGIDANQAGKGRRRDCVLYVTEGRSGAGYANKLLGLEPQGRDLIGVLPMKGKLFNVMDKNILSIEKNVEISEMKKMLGLKEGTDYSDEAAFSTLRYGSLMIMADSDVDGKHIIGLILNFFHCRFPSLLKRGFVMHYRTPTIRVTNGKKTVKFYTAREYDEWKNTVEQYGSWKHKYYKGLGTSNDKEIDDDRKTSRIVKCVYDDAASDSLILAFHRKMRNQRKAWIGGWYGAESEGDVDGSQAISSFIHNEMILFSIADTQRSIPKLMDGFKESQRKVVYAAHLKWKISSSPREYDQVKVAQFSGFVAEKSKYHHGEMILADVIIGMVQDFTGSNNVPWFQKDGQFGCVHPRTRIRTSDGNVKEARDVVEGDLLAGDDDKPRYVSKTVRGVSRMVRIDQEGAGSYVVNDIHILTLSNSSGVVFDISVPDYLSLSEKIRSTLRGVSYDRTSGQYTHRKISHLLLPYGEYVGWYLDGNERFLLEDGTVTHNTRYQLGKDAAEPRYSFTRPHKMMGLLLRREDVDILTPVVDEGEKVEPETYYPIVPMALINGAEGIGTGYSTFIPNHDVLDVIEWLKLKLSGVPDRQLPEVVPWYRGFNGTIRVIDRKKTRGIVINNSLTIPMIEIDSGPEDEEDHEDEERESSGSRPLLSMVSTGKFKVNSDRTIIIDELPVGKSPESYHKWLEMLVEEKKISGFRDMSVDDRVYFEIYDFKDTPNLKTLHLIKKKGMSNMVLLQDNGVPTRYDTAFDILEAFYARRLPVYERRKAHVIATIESEVTDLREKISFLRSVISGELKIINRPISEVRADMERLNIPYSLYENCRMRSLSIEDVEKLSETIRQKEEERDVLSRTSPGEIWTRELEELEEAVKSTIKRPTIKVKK